MGSRRTRRRKRAPSTDDSSSESDSDSDSPADSSALSSSSSDSDSDSSPSDSSNSDSDSASDSGSSSGEDDGDDFDDSKFPNEDQKKTVEEIKELVKQARVMKYENQIIEKCGIDSYGAMRDCDERKLKKLGMGYSDRDRLLQAFRKHLEEVQDRNRERWQREKDIRKGGKGGKSGSSKKKGSSSSSSKKKSSRGKSKSSKSSKSSKNSKSSKTKKGNTKSKGKSTKSKVDPDEALRNIDNSWSGKRQAWKDFKEHEAHVAELVEFYDEIGKKRTNAEEHARKLLCSYPGGIHKLVIALDKKYHHIPYGWEELLEEAYRLQEYESGSD